MAQTPPIIHDGILTYQQDGHLAQVVVDSPGWYAWLQNASTFTFRSQYGNFTAHKERAGNQRGRLYWRAYQTRNGKLHRLYLGQSEELTLQRLKSVATRLGEPRDGEAVITGQALDENTVPPPPAAPWEKHRLRGGTNHPYHQRTEAEETLQVKDSIKPWLASLPVPLTTFIGREQEVSAICDLLSHPEMRLLTITGAGGIGKTRLGLQVAAELSDRFADGVFFVNLAPISDSTFVVPAIAQALDLKETGEQPLHELLRASLQDKQLLLLLDNFEQVLGAASQVADLLVACPRLKVLVTSRFVLHVRGEQEFTVPPLAVPNPKHVPDLATLLHYEAIALFIARAQTVKPDFQVTNANVSAVAEICARLDGLPLAIELAAARVKLLPPQPLLTRLDQRLAVLTSGARDVPARQQTLRNTIAWSYHLLDAEEQRLFRRLSVFAGGCTLAAIEAICTTLGDKVGPVLDAVASLIDKSLLQQIEQEGEEPRLLMLETIREYGLEALAVNGEMEDGRRAHATYYLALAEEAEPELEGPQQVTWLERLEQEHDNLRAAFMWLLEPGVGGQIEHRRELALRLGGVLRAFWITRAYLSEGRTLLERALAASAGTVTAGRAKALVAAAELACAQEDNQRGEVLAQEGLLLCHELGDKVGMAFSLYILGLVASYRGEPTRACSLFEESVALFRELDDKQRLAWSLMGLGNDNLDHGEYAKARTRFMEALGLFRELDNKEGIAGMLYMLAQLLFFSQENPATARSLAEEALGLSRELGSKGSVASVLNVLGDMALSQDDVATARSLVEEALALFRELGRKSSIAWSLHLVARVETRQGNYATAHRRYEELLALARERDDRLYIPLYLEGLAEVVAVEGEKAWAARLWGAAASLRAGLSSPLPPAYRADYESAVAAVCAQLGEKTFAAAWAQGRTMTLEQVLGTQGRETLPEGVHSVVQLTTAKTQASYPARLTAREVEVLRLVAAGLTDTKVAEQLVISPRTVTTHLSSIYNKLGITSRTAATRFAVEQGLI
jgi:predicted ATPase/DNA-binding CsgD family transcriptional regulator